MTLHNPLSGTWWPATGPRRPHLGTLTFHTATGGRLVLGRTSADPPTSTSPPPDPTVDDAIFHGALDSGTEGHEGEPVTLLGVTALGHTHHAGEEATEDLVADVVLRGAQVESADAHHFREAVAEIPELAPWMHPAHQDSSDHPIPSTTPAVQISVPCVTTSSPDMHGLHITVETMEPSAPPRSGAAEAPAAHPPAPPRMSVRLSAEDSGLSVKEIRRHFHALQDLITLATLAPPAPLEVRLQPGDGPSGATLYWRQSLTSAAPNAAGRSLVFSSADIPFQTALPRWYPLYRQHRVAVDLLMGVLRTPHRFTEMNLLVLIASAEALFATTDDRSTRQRKDSTLRIKLAAMADRVSLDGIVGMSLPSQEWADRAARARNSFTHTGEAAGYSPSQLRELIGISVTVVVLNLLRDLGIPASAWHRGLSHNPLLRRLCPAQHVPS
ncbi:ApeA N-terminal domain 1-containing protein [Nesterenkonia suensis]